MADKVLVVVSDNAANMIAAVKKKQSGTTDNVVPTH